MNQAAGLEPAAGMRLDRRLLRLLDDQRPAMALVVLLGALLAGVITASAWLISKAVASAFLQGGSLESLATTLRALVLLALVRGGLVYLRGWAASHASSRIRAKLRRRLTARLIELGPSYNRAGSTGELTALIFDGVEALDPYFRQYLPQLITTAVIPLVILLVVLPLDPLSGWVLLLTAPLIPFFMILIGRSANHKLSSQWTQLQVMSGHFLEQLQGLHTIKVLGRSADQLDRIRQISDQFRRSTLSVLRIAFLSALVLELAATISTAIVAVQIGLRLLSGQMSFAVGFFVLLLAPEYYLPLRQLGAHFHSSVSGLTAADGLFEILQAPAETQHSDDRLDIIPASTHLSIEIQDISFRYPTRDSPALHQFSLSLHPGQMTALVGPSGAGKTTLLQLLLQFIRPQSGTIQANGSDISTFDPEAWRRSLVYVPQQPFLLAASLEQNIRFGNRHAKQDQIARAAEQAGLATLIQSLPAGLSTQLGEGGFGLSGGQAQRVALARAFLRDAPLLLLDEPTSDLDPETEDGILQVIHKLRQQRTTLWVSHRLNTTLEADQVVLLAGGRIAESGPPRQLLADQGSYWRMMRAFLGGELDD